jgi:hypothetical protein
MPTRSPHPKLPFKWHSSIVDSLIDAEMVKPHPRNPNNGDVDLVRDSIITNGVYRHIYANKKTKEIVAGHTQYHVEVELQLEAGVQRPVVPISWTDGDSKAALRQLVVDNGSAAHAKMDDALLLDLLRDFEDDFEGLGYYDYDLDSLKRHADNMALGDVDLSTADDVSAGTLRLEEGQMLVNVIIEEEFKQALYDVLADLPYVLDVRNAK